MPIGEDKYFCLEWEFQGLFFLYFFLRVDGDRARNWAEAEGSKHKEEEEEEASEWLVSSEGELSRTSSPVVVVVVVFFPMFQN